MKKVISFRKCGNYEAKSVAEAIRFLLDDLGGAEKFFKRGSKVLLKPNFLISDPKMKGIITHPAVIRAVAEIALENGCNVSIGDSPGFGSVKSILAKSGFKNFFSDLPVKLIEFEESVELKNEKGLFKRYKIAKDILDADIVVNLPKVKTHGQMLMSLAVKNMFGSIIGTRKPQWHLNAGNRNEDFGKMIAELNSLINPGLNIIDGIIGMEGLGPSAGDSVALGFLGGSEDALSLDYAVCRLLKIDPDKVFYIKGARELGLAEGYDDINLVGDQTDAFKINNFKLPPVSSPEMLGLSPSLGAFLKDALTTRPFIKRNACILCEICVKQCPARVMQRIKNKSDGKELIKIDYRNCIRCFCCQEICPEEAITIKSGWLLKIVKIFRI